MRQMKKFFQISDFVEVARQHDLEELNNRNDPVGNPMQYLQYFTIILTILFYYLQYFTNTMCDYIMPLLGIHNNQSENDERQGLIKGKLMILLNNNNDDNDDGW